MRFSWTEREKNIGALWISVVALFGAYRLWIAPLSARYQTAGRTIRQQTQRAARQGPRVGRQAAEAQEYAGLIRGLRQRASQDAVMARMIARIEEAARASGMPVVDIQPEPVRHEPPFNYFSVRVTAQSSLSAAMAFLARLQGPPLYWTIDGIECERVVRQKAVRVKTSLTVQQIRIVADGIPDEPQGGQETKAAARADNFWPDVPPPGKAVQAFTRKDMFYGRPRAAALKPKPKSGQASRPARTKAVPEPSPLAGLKRDYRLLGVLIDADPLAVIRDVRNQETLILREGAAVGSAVLTRILPEKVIVTHDERSLQIRQSPKGDVNE
jgi:hypothetical protein